MDTILDDGYEFIYQYENNQFVNVATGEIIPKDSLKKGIENKAFLEFQELDNALKELGIDLRLKLTKSKTGKIYTCINVKERYVFGRMYKIDMQYILKQCKLNPYSIALITILQAFLQFPSNTIVIDGKHPSREELGKLINVKERKLSNVLKELKEYDIIKTQQLLHNHIIFVNPFLINSGLVDVDTYKMFEDSIWNPHKKV